MNKWMNKLRNVVTGREPPTAVVRLVEGFVEEAADVVEDAAEAAEDAVDDAVEWVAECTAKLKQKLEEWCAEMLRAVRKRIEDELQALENELPWRYGFPAERFTKVFPKVDVDDLKRRMTAIAREYVDKHGAKIKIPAPPFLGAAFDKLEVAAQRAAGALELIELPEPPAFLELLDKAAALVSGLKLDFGIERGERSGAIELYVNPSLGPHTGSGQSMEGLQAEAKVCFLFDSFVDVVRAIMVKVFRAVKLIDADGSYPGILEGLIVASDVRYLDRVIGGRVRVELDGSGRFSRQLFENVEGIRANVQAGGDITMYFWPSHVVVKYRLQGGGGIDVDVAGIEGRGGAELQSNGVFRIDRPGFAPFWKNPEAEIKKIRDKIEEEVKKHALAKVVIGGVTIEGKMEELGELEGLYDRGDWIGILVCLRDGVTIELPPALAPAIDAFKRDAYWEAVTELVEAFDDTPHEKLDAVTAKQIIFDINNTPVDDDAADKVCEVLDRHPDLIQFAYPATKAHMLECLIYRTNLLGNQVREEVDGDAKAAMNAILRETYTDERQEIYRHMGGQPGEVRGWLQTALAAPIPPTKKRP